MTFDGLECHADLRHVLHDDAGEDQFLVERAFAHLRFHFGLRLAQEVQQSRIHIAPNFFNASAAGMLDPATLSRSIS
ncbi:hypothetical protein D3C85_1341310 [compost metagenome]